MNPANRLEKILLKIKQSKHIDAILVFEEALNADGCIEVSNRLRICHAQIKKLGNGAHPQLLSFLNTLFNDQNICRDITSQISQIDSSIVALHTAASYMKNEEINQKELKELTELLKHIKHKIDKAEVTDEYKAFLYKYSDEIMEGVVEIYLGGIESFEQRLSAATGIYVIHHQAFEESKLINETKKIFEKSINILSYSGTWRGSLGFLGTKLLG